MTPFKEPLGSPEAGGYCEYTLHLTETQIKIGYSFGILKNKLGLLKGIYVNIQRAEDHVRAVA